MSETKTKRKRSVPTAVGKLIQHAMIDAGHGSIEDFAKVHTLTPNVIRDVMVGKKPIPRAWLAEALPSFMREAAAKEHEKAILADYKALTSMKGSTATAEDI